MSDSCSDAPVKKRRITLEPLSSTTMTSPVHVFNDLQGAEQLVGTDKYNQIVSLLHCIGTPGCGVEIKLSSIAGAGRGLFAVKPFTVGEPITAYYGELVTHAESKKRNASHLRSLFAMRFAIDGRYMLDGTPITEPETQLAGHGAAAFANDARDQEKNNAEFLKIDSPKNLKAYGTFASGGPWQLDPGESKIILYATKPIKAGQEIFVSYGDDYWKRAEEANDAEITKI